MRCLRWAFAAIVALTLSSGARAQTNNFQTALTGVKSSDIQFTPINTSSALQLPTGTTQMNSGFSLTGFFRRVVGLNSASPIRGVSNIPSAQYQPAISPLPPVISTVPR